MALTLANDDAGATNVSDLQLVISWLYWHVGARIVQLGIEKLSRTEEELTWILKAMTTTRNDGRCSARHLR